RRLDGVASDRQRRHIEKGIDEAGFRIRQQQHVGSLNSLPTGDRRAVEEVAGFKFLRTESLDRHADVLFLAARIRKAQVDEFDVFILDSLEYFFWSHNFFL